MKETNTTFRFRRKNALSLRLFFIHYRTKLPAFNCKSSVSILRDVYMLPGILGPLYPKTDSISKNV